jgi:HEPN domain-containing protein
MEADDIEKLKLHWLESSDKDFQTMEHLMNSGDCHWALFIGHIVLERLLKALYIQLHRTHAPFIHDLLRLTELCALSISEQDRDALDTITTFNLNARYDSYKKEFYRKCTPEYAALWVNKIKELRLWIKSQL